MNMTFKQAEKELADRYKFMGDNKNLMPGISESMEALDIAINSIEMQLKIRQAIWILKKEFKQTDSLSRDGIIETLLSVYCGDPAKEGITKGDSKDTYDYD